MEAPDETPHPRTPPPRSFSMLEAAPIHLGAEAYRAHSIAAPRYDAYDWGEERNEPRWSDEAAFYDWLVAARLPRHLAEMLYASAPEVSFLLGPGHILGVDRLIENNPPAGELRRAGFFQLASGPNGDPVVVSLSSAKAGETGYLPHDVTWVGAPADQLRRSFIPVAASIGAFFEAFAEEDCSLPRDYYDAKERPSRPAL